MKTKVLFVSPLPPPHYGSAISSGICLDILKNSEEFEVLNIKLNYSKDVTGLGKFSVSKVLGFFHVFIAIWKSMRKDKPDIVYFVPATFGIAQLRDFIFLWLIKRFGNTQLILALRAQFTEKDWNNSFKRPIIKSILKCDKIILLGPELKDNLKSTVADEKIFFLPNAISSSLTSEEFLKIIEKRRANSELNLFFLSNMQEFKGWYKLLQTCKLLKEAEVNFKCHFAGGWPSEVEKVKFDTYVDNNLLQDMVIHHGKLFDERKSKMFEKADIFVLPTDFDACPRVLIEAMEFGLPIISTQVGTIPSMVSTEETGFIIDKNNPIELFGKICKLCDDKLRHDIGQKGRERFLEKFTMSSYKKRLVSIILSPLSS